MIKWVLISLVVYQFYQILSQLNYDVLEKNLLNHLNSITVKYSIFDQLYQQIEYTSGIKQRIPSLNLFNSIFSESVLILVSYYVGFKITHLILPSLIISLISGIIPLMLLNFMCQKREDLISKFIANFISTMARWSFINDDIFYCLEKASESAEEPIQSYVQLFLLHVKYSGNMIYAFDILLIQSGNELYRNLILNLKQSDYSKGDLNQLLIRLEEEAFRIEGEHSRRDSETYFDRLIIFFTVWVVLFIAVFILLFNESMRTFYLGSTVGHYLLMFYTGLFILGIYVASRIRSFNY